MKHSGKARYAAGRLILTTLAVLGIVWLAGFVGRFVPWPVLAGFTALWCGLFLLFTLYFFRDPEPRVPDGAGLIVAPGHGTVDVIDETTEPEVLGGPCRRVSIFLSVFDVHVQNAPTAGRVVYFRHKPGGYANAMRPASALANENVLLGLEAQERTGVKVGVRLIAGLIARRIVPWVALGDDVARGERIGLIQFGSRVELYLPPSVQIKVRLGDKVVGGETVVAVFGPS